MGELAHLGGFAKGWYIAVLCVSKNAHICIVRMLQHKEEITKFVYLTVRNTDNFTAKNLIHLNDLSIEHRIQIIILSLMCVVQN